jgi:hypothetical protein
MPLTANQVAAFFENADQMGIPKNVFNFKKKALTMLTIWWILNA